MNITTRTAWLAWHGIATVKTVTDEYGYELGAYDTPYNFCPNCGRKIKED